MPLPNIGKDKCAKGAKSPDAPKDPCSYITGIIDLLKREIKKLTKLNLTPE